ncbi:serine esterase, putative (macronuclear) [Tetrahymena thermophila SB210]|uniref:Serine esterase, putative n=1 Tax=Tetrahymena thermophila (strain SB210) TaxID=312017 RepID=Q23D68_TETTS|nr:serine esterase, putative [Tetrahymena thermophila SB210]EAR94467.2 serine esterase, putative [Tetrahymena thermophila SB210]|eukprot:XP_001014818.2 serine esterase, putative [Tetrahymena thermophila SB210]
MSVRSIVDLVVHVQNFRNIDLFYQGLYFLKFTIYQLKGKDQKIYAHPYNITENYKPYSNDFQQPKGQKFNDSQLFRPAGIIDQTSSFYSKSFFIKFCEEEVELNDFCHFRIEFDAGKQGENPEMYMEVELMFFDCMNNSNNKNTSGQGGKDGQKDSNKNENKDNNTNNTTNSNKSKEECCLFNESKSLSTIKYKLNDVTEGIHEFVPLLFEEANFCVANVIFHSIRLDYRFRVIPIQISEFAKYKPEERLALMDIQKNQSASKTISIYESTQKQLGNIDYEGMYNTFVESLKKTYSKLYNHYNKMNSRCILDKQKKTFKKYLQPPSKLITPEYVTNENVREYSQSNNQNGKQNQNKDFNTVLQERFKSRDPETITHSILNEANLISGQLFQLWHKYLDLYKISPLYCLALLKFEYQQKIKDRLQIFIVKQKINNQDFKKIHEQSKVEQNEKVAYKMRPTLPILESKFLNKVEPIYSIFKTEHNPIIFEELIVKDVKEKNEENIIEYELNGESENIYYKGIHLFVLVHGFQGNAYDMKMLKNYLNYMHPEAMFLCSVYNEDNTEGDIDEMGKNLANEIQTFIADNCSGENLGRISLIGFSLGGVIIRSALPMLEEYSEKMYTFMSLSSPHLGFMYNPNKIIEAGIWILKRWKKSTSLQQLTMADSKDIENTFLYRLSKAKGLGWFKNVCLVSSYQDSYAPFDSARIEMTKEAMKDAKGKLYNEMTQNILSQLSTNSLHRLDVHFHIQEKNIDTLIGRAAHIQFLECQPLIRILVQNYDTFFR